jgi:hypothetical protein
VARHVLGVLGAEASESDDYAAGEVTA